MNLLEPYSSSLTHKKIAAPAAAAAIPAPIMPATPVGFAATPSLTILSAIFISSETMLSPNCFKSDGIPVYQAGAVVRVLMTEGLRIRDAGASVRVARYSPKALV